jgi:triacylglycerol lipase
MSSHSYHYTLARYADEYPDLDPITGLPQQRSVSDGTAPERLRVQRTISQLSRYSASGSPEAVNTGPFGLPPLPSLPLPSLRGTRSSIDLSQSLRRTFTASSKASAASDGGVSVAAKFTSLFGGGNKHDALLSEDDQGQTAEEEEAKHHIKYRTPQHPMVFCHGLLGFDYLGPDAVPALQISHWRGIREVLEANGVEVMIARVPATSSIKDRATILHGLIADKYPGRTVNLVAHSMGGLDCRYLISELAGDDFSVASLTTISTPHRGSPFADYVIDSVIGRDRLPQLLGMMEAMRLPETSGDGTALAALGTRAMAEFNMQIVDDPDVKYYSWGASFEPGLLDTFRWPWSVIMAKEGPNDGMVSVASARWGEYRGTLLGVNHLDL